MKKKRTQPLSFPANLIAESFAKKDIAGLLKLSEQNGFFEVKNDDGDTPLHLACEHNLFDLIEPFIQAGADINIQNKYGDTPLAIASFNTHFKIVKYLVRNGAAINIADNNGDIPLHKASKTEYEYNSIIQYLIDNGADIHYKNKQGQLPFHQSSFETNNVIELYLNLGVNIDSQANNGDTILHLACQNGYSDLVEFLISKDPDINIANNQGNTPLHLCSFFMELDIAKILIQHEANMYLINSNDENALDTAMHLGYTEIVELLQTYDNYQKIKKSISSTNLNSISPKIKI